MRAAVPFVLFAVLSACTSAVDEPGPPPATAATAARPNATFALVTRDHKVTWLSGRDVRFRVEDASGAVVAERADLGELETIDPLLGAAVRNATAGVGGGYLDARGGPKARTTPIHVDGSLLGD